MTRCFLDLDGVLADFVCGALKLHGKQMAYADVRWDFHASVGMSQEAFWLALGEEFWQSLDRTPEFDAIIQTVLERFEPAKVFILSSPCQTAGCVTGKARWVEKHLPQFARRLLLTNDKEIFAGSGVLIDDSESNWQKWTQAGGRCFLFPRPWNMQRDEEARAVENLKAFLAS